MFGSVSFFTCAAPLLALRLRHGNRALLGYRTGFISLAGRSAAHQREKRKSLENGPSRKFQPTSRDTQPKGEVKNKTVLLGPTRDTLNELIKNTRGPSRTVLFFYFSLGLGIPTRRLNFLLGSILEAFRFSL